MIHRPKNGHDGALPSGNAVATQALLWLGNLTGNLPYHTAADRSLRLYFSQMKEQPAGYTTMTAALETYSASQPVLLLAGPQAKDWKGKIEQEMDPESFVIDLTEAIRQSILLPEGMRKHFPENRTTGWICRGTVCLLPVDTFESLRAGLAAKTSSYGENV